MRLLKFFGVFLITSIVIFALVFGFNWKSFTIFLENREAMAEGSEWVEKTYSLEGLTEFIDEHPEYVSVASIVTEYPDSVIFYGEDIPRVMGTASNLILMLAYAGEIETGRLSAGDEINWSDVDAYQLPDVEESVHQNAYRTGKDRGWILNDTLSLENAIKLLAEYNDLALADYLWWKLDSDSWDRTHSSYNLQNTDSPLPFSGLYLSIAPSIQNMTSEEIISKWSGSPDDEWRAHVISQSMQFLNDYDKREKITNILESDRLGATFIEERNAMSLFPKTTAIEMASLMQTLLNRAKNGDKAAILMKEWLEWPLQQTREIRRDFSDYGALFDNRLGILNGIDFGTSSYTGDTTVQAVFFDRLPIAFWFHMSSNHMHQDFQQRMIFDPAMIERMKKISTSAAAFLDIPEDENDEPISSTVTVHDNE